MFVTDREYTGREYYLLTSLSVSLEIAARQRKVPATPRKTSDVVSYERKPKLTIISFYKLPPVSLRVAIVLPASQNARSIGVSVGGQRKEEEKRRKRDRSSRRISLAAIFPRPFPLGLSISDKQVRASKCEFRA